MMIFQDTRNGCIPTTMTDPFQPHPHFPGDDKIQASADEGASAVDYEASEPPDPVAASCALIDAMIDIDSPFLPDPYRPEQAVPVSSPSKNTSIPPLDSSDTTVSMDWRHCPDSPNILTHRPSFDAPGPSCHKIPEEPQDLEAGLWASQADVAQNNAGSPISFEFDPDFDPFNGVLDAILDVGPSLTRRSIVDLVTPSPSPPPIVDRQTWIDRATSRANLEQVLIHCPEHPQLPGDDYEICHLPLLCARYARAKILLQIQDHWNRQKVANWRRELDDILARKRDLKIWEPLAAWLHNVDLAKLDNFESEEQNYAKYTVLKRLRYVAQDKRDEAADDINLLCLSEQAQVYAAIEVNMRAMKHVTSSFRHYLGPLPLQR